MILPTDIGMISLFSPLSLSFGYLDVRELGEHHVGCGGMEGWELPIQVGKTHQ